MAYNTNTGETILNGRTYTPHRRGALLHYRSLKHIADSGAGLTGETRHVLIAATRAFYHITNDRTAFLIGRSVIRGLRNEATA
jgi:hypothetical protein